MELPNHTLQHRPLRGLDAFTKTYYHLPGVGVVDEKSLGRCRDLIRFSEPEIKYAISAFIIAIIEIATWYLVF